MFLGSWNSLSEIRRERRGAEATQTVHTFNPPAKPIQSHQRLPQPVHKLFADAEAAEDAVQDVVGVGGAGDSAEFVEGGAEFGGD